MDTKPKEEVVKERAQARADAMVAGKFKAVYEFYSPTARKTMQYEDFVLGTKMGNWKGATVDRVQCSSEDLCDVDLTVDFAHRLARIKGPLRQTWIREGNSWWYAAKE